MIESVLDEVVQEEIKELVSLIRLDEKFIVLVADGLFPLDHGSSHFHHLRIDRIDELSRKYGLLS